MNNTITPVIPEPYEGSEPYCFVSYAHNDKQLVYPIVNALCDAGIRVWYDKGLNIGEPYHEIILQQIKNCSCFIVFFSKWAVDITRSEFITNEVGQARKFNKPILPVFIDEIISLPAKLIFNGVSDLHSYILRHDNQESSSQVLAELFETIPQECKVSPFRLIPYDDDLIDTTLRRCVVSLAVCASSVSSKLLVDEIKRLVSSLYVHEETKNSVDISILYGDTDGNVIVNDITPVSLLSDLEFSFDGAAPAAKTLTLVNDIVDNCIEFYSDIGVACCIPVKIVVCDFCDAPEAYSDFTAHLESKPAYLQIVNLGEASAVAENLIPYVVSNNTDNETALHDSFTVLINNIFSHLGHPLTKISAPISPPSVSNAAESTTPAFRQRKISQIKKGE